jgi:hypothetical protein
VALCREHVWTLAMVWGLSSGTRVHAAGVGILYLLSEGRHAVASDVGRYIIVRKVLDRVFYMLLIFMLLRWEIQTQVCLHTLVCRGKDAVVPVLN